MSPNDVSVSAPSSVNDLYAKVIYIPDLKKIIQETFVETDPEFSYLSSNFYTKPEMNDVLSSYALSSDVAELSGKVKNNDDNIISISSILTEKLDESIFTSTISTLFEKINELSGKIDILMHCLCCTTEFTLDDRTLDDNMIIDLGDRTDTSMKINLGDKI